MIARERDNAGKVLSTYSWGNVHYSFTLFSFPAFLFYQSNTIRLWTAETHPLLRPYFIFMEMRE
jgi:hypothetical protein